GIADDSSVTDGNYTSSYDLVEDTYHTDYSDRFSGYGGVLGEIRDVTDDYTYDDVTTHRLEQRDWERGSYAGHATGDGYAQSEGTFYQFGKTVDKKYIEIDAKAWEWRLDAPTDNWRVVEESTLNIKNNPFEDSSNDPFYDKDPHDTAITVTRTVVNVGS